MTTFEYICLIVVAACGLLLLIPGIAAFFRNVAIILALACGMWGVFGVSLCHRLAWVQRPEGAAQYSERDKDVFEQGTSATFEAARRFLPLILGSLVVLTVGALRNSQAIALQQPGGRADR